MPSNSLLSADHNRLAPVDARYAALFCFALLTMSCALASGALACATPFAAFAVAAAAMLPSRQALTVVTGAWLVNQTIGFGIQHYPIDGPTIAWGFVMGAAALAATVASIVTFRALPQLRTPIALAVAVVCAYATYELVLVAATPFLGGTESFSAAIVSRLGLLSAAWLVGMVAVCEIVRLLNPMKRPSAT